jgi:hypothetical protein
MFIFLSPDNIFYTNPDSYICDQKHETIEWGTEMNIYPVYRKGNPVLLGHQTIKATFTHEGKYGNTSNTLWITNGNYFELNRELITSDKIIKFDKLGPNHPTYYHTFADLTWYLEHIYQVDKIRTS